MSALREYRFPRNKISALVRAGEIIRVKKGIYVKADEPFDSFILANMIYGPSYVSEDAALAHYGLIPEAVATTTSTTCGHKRVFDTPVGTFSYESQALPLYTLGIRRAVVSQQQAYLIASPEKALFDRLRRVKGLKSEQDIASYLFNSMRLDEDAVTSFKLSAFSELHNQSRRTFIKKLVHLFKKMRRT